jgi:hypothetical protein
MSFTLHVEFSGPLLYVADTPETIGEKQLAASLGVVMPDCRLPETEERPMHLDGEEADPHAGYLRMDLGDVDPRFPRGEEQNPVYELVHRFSGQVLRFVEIPAEENDEEDPAEDDEQQEEEGADVDERIDITGMSVPEFERVAPELVLKDNLFAEDAEILMRTVLEGGIVTAGPLTEWKFEEKITAGGEQYQARFASFVTWTRDYAGSGLTVEITSLTGETQVSIPLTIHDGAEVHMKVANLCATNPLEWPELDVPKTPDVDADFKWLYRLFDNVPEEIPALPVPRLVNAAEGETGDNGCMGTRVSGSTG